MTAVNRKHEWTDFLKFYNEQNKERRTRLGVFDTNSDVVTDYWLEDGLPFEGIDIDTRDEMPTIEIVLKDFVHEVRDARKLTAHFSFDKSEDGLDITDSKGNTTILRFEQ